MAVRDLAVHINAKDALTSHMGSLTYSSLPTQILISRRGDRRYRLSKNLNSTPDASPNQAIY